LYNSNYHISSVYLFITLRVALKSRQIGNLSIEILKVKNLKA
jgi:hypothetical protein